MIENKQRKTKYVISAVVFSVVGVLMALYAVTLIIPIIWGLISSVKDTYDYTLHPFSLPDIWFFENYASAWNGLSVEVWNPSSKTLADKLAQQGPQHLSDRSLEVRPRITNLPQTSNSF